MPIDLTIPQVMLVADASGVRMVAKSDDFPADWEPDAERVVAGFGTRPEGVSVSAAVAVLPFGKRHTAVIQFAEQSAGLTFRLLVLNRPLYSAISDPFAVADTFPPNWSARRSLPSLSWVPDPVPPRTVTEVAAILHHDGPLLLGATQALIDGLRVVLAHPTPDDTVPRRLWKLLPYSTRDQLSIATFTFALDPRFHLSVTPTPPTPLPFGTVGEENCRDLPEGRYELALQVAAETENQGEVNRLFHRRSSGDTLKIALLLVAVALVAAVVSKLVW